MKVCVFGLWHLGSVTAACLASGGHQVVGLDFNYAIIQGLQVGQPPLFEPGLEDLIKQGLSKGNLHFSTDLVESVKNVDVVWVTYDTPVDEDDHADIDYVVERVNRLFPALADGTLVLISSQLPVGTTRHLEEVFGKAYPKKQVSFGCSPENLRLGKAISVFTQPDRVVVGVRSVADRVKVEELLHPFTDHLEWMSVESAEMTKHAINAFLAISVVFANEIAVLCEQVGADAKEVERGLKTETRIGPKAYLGPGVAFAGGTLARDIAFLAQLGQEREQPTPLLSSVKVSNDQHKLWVRNKLLQLIGSPVGRSIAVWGLTYKPGTDTLRRSSSIELCKWLAEQGARVLAHDPVVKKLPFELQTQIELCPNPVAALNGTVALIVATEWPEYLTIPPAVIISAMESPIVIDPNRFLERTLGREGKVHYATVGKVMA